jgi:hypothetical protein
MAASPNPHLAAALAADAAGLSVMPPKEDGSKMPDAPTWTAYHTLDPATGRYKARLTPDNIRAAYATGRTGVGAFMGAPSGNVELFDFDSHETFDAFLLAADALGLGELVNRIRDGYEEETPNGVHWYYRCAEIAGNRKLALRPAPTEVDPHRVKALIETRGTGGYAVMAPSNGRVHPEGGAYRVTRGSVSTIATITPEERRALWDLARSFDELPDEAPQPEPAGGGTSGDAPGHIYNQRATWADVLTPHGWALVYERNGTGYWRRPGKDRGHSATTNAKGTDTFHCFSSSTPFRLSPSSYNKFGVYTVLNHGGDFSAAAKALYEQGYRAPEAGAHWSPKDDGATAAAPVALADFISIGGQNRYIYRPTGAFWEGAEVNRRLGKVGDMAAATWLDRHQSAEALTWQPGEPEMLVGRYFVGGDWVPHAGARTYNLYRPARWTRQRPDRAPDAGPWLGHLCAIYPDEWEHILAWLAHRVQRPGEKVNHALVLGGDPGIGKDTILDPVRLAVGAANFEDVTPAQVMGRFNAFARSVILRVSEIRDLGEVNRYSFYEHTKVLIASPPETLWCDEKYLRPYAVPNLCGVVFTTNHRQGGLYLPGDDRRHFVVWSEATRDECDAAHFDSLYGWYDAGGRAEVAEYLGTYDLDAASFNPKAPPPQTEAFWAMVDAGHSPESSELADVLEALGNPDAVTLEAIKLRATAMQNVSLVLWLDDRKSQKQIPHRMGEAGYVVVRNPYEPKRGRWVIDGRRLSVYSRRALSPRERLTAAERLQRGRA